LQTPEHYSCIAQAVSRIYYLSLLRFTKKINEVIEKVYLLDSLGNHR